MSILKTCSSILRLNHFKYSHFIKVRNISEAIINDHTIDQFNRDGAICLRGVFDKSWLDLVDEGLKKNIKEPSKYCDWLADEDGKGLFFNDYFNYKLIKEYHDYIVSSPAAEIAGRLMQSTKSIFFHEHVFFKAEGSSKESPWHHDQAYYPCDGNQNCSVWMPTSFVRKQSSVKFIKGSHKWPKYFVPVKFASHKNYVVDDEVMANNKDIETTLKNVKDEDILQWELEPGDCIAFHMKTVHGTEQSNNPASRRVMVTRWLGDDMTYTDRPWETSPPAELLPPNLKFGHKFANNGYFIIPWQVFFVEKKI